MGSHQIFVRTRAVVFNEEGKLLVQHHKTAKHDFYRLPGGGVRFKEKLEDCIIREIREETQLDVDVDRLLWVRDFTDQLPYHSIEVFFLATVIGGEFNPAPEGKDIELRFVNVEDLEKTIFYPKAFLPKLKLLRDNREFREEDPYAKEAN
ncbi:MAG: NUDIX hydrolase [Candidatus Bathyarchaeota archaeon]|nr:MAG: NUDIX hydrolase [Candidatus Bathyarchaeota archaeon]